MDASLGPLEPELCCNLADAWIGGLGNCPKTAWIVRVYPASGTNDLIADVAIDGVAAIELGMIEDVEHFETQFKRTRLGKVRYLVQRHVEVVDAGAIEVAALGVALRSESIGTECIRVEKQFTLARVAVDFVPRAVVLGHIDARSVDTIVLDLHQIVVALGANVTGTPVEKRVTPESAHPLVRRLG